MSFPVLFLWLSPIFGLSLDLHAADQSATPNLAVVATEADLAAATDATAQSPGPADSEPSVADQMARRGRIGRIHRAMGLATWSAMTLSVISGIVQYRNLYGFFSPLAQTPCVTGHVVSERSCVGQPIFHATTTALTTLLYYTTFSLSFAMPDPIGLDQGDSASARRLRRHKRLRWVHFSGMAAQMLLGIYVANAERFGGVDRTNNYGLLRALATVHLAIGLTTYGTLTWAGATMMHDH